MTAYYNEIDPFAAEWLQNLIVAGHIAPGDIDQRSIVDVRPSDLRGYDQCHFFAGIGGWSLALRLAGWPDDRPVWTGSCPCQPFSSAGKGAGFADERHLWPSWYWLISQCRPAIIFGEQVAAKAVEPWVDLVQADMEALGYAFGCAPFPAASVGAPHIRDRLSFVADRVGYAGSVDAAQERESVGVLGEQWASLRRGPVESAGVGATGGTRGGYCSEGTDRIGREDVAPPRVDSELADADGGHASAERRQRGGQHGLQPQDGSVGEWLADRLGEGLEGRDDRSLGGECPTAQRGGAAGLMVLTNGGGAGAQPGDHCEARKEAPGRPWPDNRTVVPLRASAVGHWSDAEWLPCRDGKARPVEPGTFPLVDGLQRHLDSVFSLQDIAVSEVRNYAARSNADPHQILRMVRERVLAQTGRQGPAIGVCGEFPSPALLLNFLLDIEAACNGTAHSRSLKKTGTEIIERSVRSVRRDGGVVRSPRQWPTPGQRSEQPPEALHELSFVLACRAATYGEIALAAHAVSVRSNLLRGFGNAIVPQAQAEFIAAYLDCRP